jgi:TonB family protein
MTLKDLKGTFRPALLLVCLASVALSQVPVGRYSGTVRNIQKKTVQNAVVVLFDSQTNRRYMTTTDGGGKFRFENVPAADYAVRILAQDYIDAEGTATVESKKKIDQSLTLVNSTQSPGTRMQHTSISSELTLIRTARAAYPEAARTMRQTATVVMDVGIGVDGRIEWVSVQNPKEPPILVKAAVEAVSQWVYAPRIENGVPAKATTEITTTFGMSRGPTQTIPVSP